MTTLCRSGIWSHPGPLKAPPPCWPLARVKVLMVSRGCKTSKEAGGAERRGRTRRISSSTRTTVLRSTQLRLPSVGRCTPTPQTVTLLSHVLGGKGGMQSPLGLAS